MTFTFDGYKKLLCLLGENGYTVADYHNWNEYNRCVILRHDVDNDLRKALEIAELEYQQGVKSTYFVLLTSNFYNLYSGRNRKIVNEIYAMGHTIGLHFDEMAYPEDIGHVGKVVKDIEREIDILEQILEVKVTSFSYHRPTKAVLNAEIEVQGVVNVYGKLFFKQFKYLSDSRMHWREPILDIICRRTYPSLHILTHPFWYYDKEKSIKQILEEFFSRAGAERYNDLNDNFTDLRTILNLE